MEASERRGKITEIKGLIANRDWMSAFAGLAALASPEDDFVSQARIARLYSTLPAAALGLKSIRIAVLASSTVDHFTEVLKYWMAREGFAADIWTAPFNTIEATALDPSSPLYDFAPDLVWIFTTGRDIRIEAGDESQAAIGVAEAVRHAQSLWTAIRSRMDCTILQNNADIPANDSLGNFAAQTSSSRRNLLRLYNLELGRAAATGVLLYDLEHFSALHGKERWADARYWYHSKHAFALDAYGQLAFHSARLLSALKGRARKCLVLDLDNTLWGGVIGDDGLAGIRLGNGADGEAFVDFQRWLRAMKDRGVILAVCSKNERDAAMEPFRSHPDCVLKLEDIAVFVANWTNKADNVREIADTLNIGLDSLVFVDDNAVERDFVRTQLPEVAVPDLPEDPAGYIEAIERNHYFETTSLSAEDRARAQLYRENAKRAELRDSAADITQYLRSLDMVCESGHADAFHLPRMAQLINKSNQFHLTGSRYSEAELKRLARLADHNVRYFKLRDRIGDNGLISVIVLSVRGPELHVDTWVMSCRVLGRTVEEFIRNNIVDAARHANCRAVVGRYRASAKNKLVAGLYQRLGFEKIADGEGETTWRLVIGAATPDLVSQISGAVVQAPEALDVA
jgi:FkbH-like protein